MKSRSTLDMGKKKKIHVHNTPLSKPSFSTTIKLWENENFPCSFLLHILFYFMFSRNFNMIFFYVLPEDGYV